MAARSHSHPYRNRSRRSIAVLALASISFAACGDDGGGDDAQPEASSPSAAAATSPPTTEASESTDSTRATETTPEADARSTEATEPTAGSAEGFEPVSIENCGVTTEYDAAPERAVPVDQNVTELMLTLGLEDSIAGYARVHFDPSEPVLPEYEPVYEELELLAESSPSREVFLAAEPDFAFAAFGFDEDSGLSQDGLAEDGIPTYLQPDQCEGRTDPVMFEDLYMTTRDIGAIFGVPDRAEALIEEWEATIADAQERVAGEEPVSVFVYDSGEDAPFTVGGLGSANAIIEAAGGENIFAEQQDQFFTSSWEEVLARNPDVVVIMNYFHGDDGENAETKLRVLEDRLADTTALKEGRVVDMALTGWFLSIRNADMVAELAGVLHP